MEKGAASLGEHIVRVPQVRIDMDSAPAGTRHP
jgi:hypothetical protein